MAGAANKKGGMQQAQQQPKRKSPEKESPNINSVSAGPWRPTAIQRPVNQDIRTCCQGPLMTRKLGVKRVQPVICGRMGQIAPFWEELFQVQKVSTPSAP